MANLDQERKKLPIFTIRNKLISEIQRNSSLILLGMLEIRLIISSIFNLYIPFKEKLAAVRQLKFRNTFTKRNLKYEA